MAPPCWQKPAGNKASVLLSVLTSNSVPVTELILSMLILVRVTDCQKLENQPHTDVHSLETEMKCLILIQALGPFWWLMSQDLGESIYAEMMALRPQAGHLQSVPLYSKTHCPLGMALISKQRHI